MLILIFMCFLGSRVRFTISAGDLESLFPAAPPGCQIPPNISWMNEINPRLFDVDVLEELDKA